MVSGRGARAVGGQIQNARVAGLGLAVLALGFAFAFPPSLPPPSEGRVWP